MMTNDCALFPVLTPCMRIVVVQTLGLSGFFTTRRNLAMKVAVAPIDKVVRFIKAVLNGIVGSNVPMAIGMFDPLGMNKLVLRALLSLHAVLPVQMHGVPRELDELRISPLTEASRIHVALDVLRAAHFLAVVLELAPAIAIANAVIALIEELIRIHVMCLRTSDHLHVVHVKTSMLGLLDLEEYVSFGEAVLLGNCSRTVFRFQKIKRMIKMNE